MLFFELISKINAVNSFIKLVKGWGKFIWLIVVFVIIALAIGFYSIKNYYDNSIYVDNVEDARIRSEVKYILEKCGDMHAVAVSTISTETKANYYGKFKEFWACDKSYSKECLIDLSIQEKYKSDYNVDAETYKLLEEIANDDDIKEISLGSFNIEKYRTIYEILRQSPNYDAIHTLWLTAIANKQEKIIYAISMTAWSKDYCRDGSYYIKNLKKKLPRSKLWE